MMVITDKGMFVLSSDDRNTVIKVAKVDGADTRGAAHEIGTYRGNELLVKIDGPLELRMHGRLTLDGGIVKQVV